MYLPRIFDPESLRNIWRGKLVEPNTTICDILRVYLWAGISTGHCSTGLSRSINQYSHGSWIIQCLVFMPHGKIQIHSLQYLYLWHTVCLCLCAMCQTKYPMQFSVKWQNCSIVSFSEFKWIISESVKELESRCQVPWHLSSAGDRCVQHVVAMLEKIW